MAIGYETAKGNLRTNRERVILPSSQANLRKKISLTVSIQWYYLLCYYYGNQNQEIISSRGYEKMAERFPDFEIQKIQQLEENSENQNTKKSTSTWLNVWTSWSKKEIFQTNLPAFKVRQLDENK